MSSRAKAWFLLFRPWSYTATVVPFLLGAAVLPAESVHWGRWAAGLVAGLLFQATVNLLNTWGDERSGVDDVPGAIRTTPQVHDGLVSMRAVLTAAAVCAAIGCATGLVLCLRGPRGIDWPLLVAGAVGFLGATNYSTGIKFKYRGLGVPFVSVLMGPLETTVAAHLATGGMVLGFWLSPAVPAMLLWTLPVAALVGVIMHGNDMRDIPTDRVAGIRTTASVLGPRRALALYRICHLLPYGTCLCLSAILAFLGTKSWAWTCLLLPFLALPLTARTLAAAGKVYAETPENPPWRGLERSSGAIHFAFGVLYSASFALLGLCVAGCAPVSCPVDTAEGLWRDFSAPPARAKPWCYWWWVNGHVDRETITADLEAMKRLGFGGVLMFDSRGYWDDERHVENPKAEIGWGTAEWYDMVEFSIRECARLGLEFTMNASASGGTLNGFIDGKEYETDVTSRREVVAHLDRAVGPLLKRVPELVGSTFTHIYSVSYEGNVKTGGSWKTIKDTFYAAMREWAHSHGLKVYSESGGPWAWGSKSTKLDCSQLDMLAHNDFPQGEFWPLKERGASPDAGHANGNGRFFQRGITLSSRREGRGIVSMESFTHMMRHYSVDPAFLKPLADIAFADGANRLVWHTFTCSPRKFGVPGAEYFAGSHINRNVTWHREAAAFVTYIARSQALLQRGEYVDDGEFVNVSTNYYGWGRFRKDEKAQFTTTHRREGGCDWFFVAGEGRGEVELNASCEGRRVEIWDAATATRRTAEVAAVSGGRTRVSLDLPIGGSCFVVFGEWGTGNGERGTAEDVALGKPRQIPLANAWKVSFAYPDGIAAAPPAPVTMETLHDWTSYGEGGKAESTALRYFSGTATYRTTLSLENSFDGAGRRMVLSLGGVPSGLAHVFVNGRDCGTVWCEPWEVDVSSALRGGENEIEVRYTNNWCNRLAGDCFLGPGKRVTRSTLHYWTVPRGRTDPKQPWLILPTIYSGPSISDPLQPSGLLGPVRLMVSEKARGRKISSSSK